MVPNPLHRIKIRSIRRKPFGLKPIGMLSPKQTNCFTMNAVTVQNHNKLSAQVPAESLKERHRLFRADILGMDMKVQSQTPPFWGNSDSRDDREAVVAVPTVLDRRFAFRRPCPATHRLQHKAAFIRKNDTISLPMRFFLYGANPAVASVGWLSRRVRGPCVRVFGNSSPANAEGARHDRDDTLPQSSAGLPRPLDGRSTGLWKNLLPVALLEGFSVTVFSVGSTDGMDGPDAALALRPPVHLFPTFLSIGVPKKLKPLRAWLPRKYPCLLQEALPQSAAEPLILLHFLLVSYCLCRQNIVNSFRNTELNSISNKNAGW